jgi:hypothetical protein
MSGGWREASSRSPASAAGHVQLGGGHLDLIQPALRNAVAAIQILLEPLLNILIG